MAAHVRRIAWWGAVLAGLSGALAVPSTTLAAAPPACSTETIGDRPAITRAHRFDCTGLESASLSSAPDWLAVTDLRVTADGDLAWTDRPSADAPEHGQFVVHVTGPGGQTDVTVPMILIPLSVNSPPRCAPVQLAERTSGGGPVTLQFDVSCFDDNGDPITAVGHDGPGRFVDAPTTHVSDAWVDARWTYTTATSSGPESATYWATDDLGARSEPAAISLMVGPAVDHPTECAANPAGEGVFLTDPMVTTLYTRPGVVRHFGVACWDDDGDSFSAAVDQQPSHGSVSPLTFVNEGRTDSPPGRPVYISRLYDAVYTPAGDSTEQEELVVRATRPGVPAHLSRIEIVPRALPANSPVTCGGTAEIVETGKAVDLGVPFCDDADGDPMTARVATPPSHGTVGTPTVEARPGGASAILIRYRSSTGFTGWDGFDLRVGDGIGDAALDHVDVRVDPPFAVIPPANLPPLRPAGAGQPATGQPAAVSPLQQARRALHTRSVRLLRRVGDARVFAARRVVRRGLRPRAATRALAVSCDLPCRLSALVRAGRRTASRRHARVVPGRAAVLRLKRRDARRLAHARRASFALRISARGRAHSATIRLRTRR